jgi:hypothetical protein
VMTDLTGLRTMPEVLAVATEPVDYHGERAIRVKALLEDGRAVEGTFTTQDKDSFGGVEFSSRKDIDALMVSKVRAVLEGKADLS